MRTFHDPALAALADLAARLEAVMEAPTAPPAPVPTQAQAQAPPATAPATGSTNPFAANANGQAPAAGATTGTALPATPPGAAQTAFQYVNQVAGLPITVGADLAEFFDPSNLPTTGDAFIKDVLAMPTSEQMALEWQLWQAGLYTDESGSLMQGAQIGSYDASNFVALANAVIAAHNSGLSISDVIKQNVGAGTLQGLEQKAITPTPGGGQTYQVTTPDPRDVYQATQAAYEKALGRMPTQAEYQAVLGTVNASAQQYYGTINTQKEQMSRAQYNASIESRTAKLQPTPATNALPATEPKNPADYAVALLTTMGLETTASNVAFVMAWIDAHGGMGSGNNPLGVTIGGTEQTTAGGPASFPTWQAGLQATAREIIQFPNIMAALSSNDASGLASGKVYNGNNYGPGIGADLKKWSSGAYSSLDTKAQTSAATDAANTAAAPQDVTRSQAPGFMGPLPAGQTGDQGTPSELTRQAAPNFMGPLPATEPATAAPNPSAAPATPSADITPGQNVTSPADYYIAPTTVNVTSPVDSTNAATYAAENLQGGIPYYANQWVQVMSVLNGLINSTASSEHP